MEAEEVEEDEAAACNAMVDENGLGELGLSSLSVSLKPRLTERTERPAVDTTAE
jgi:hypothetical protein